MSVSRVDKPWGYELRFVRTDRYAGKVLFIKAGAQLSLQYHEKKDEAFFVQAGSLDLVLGRGEEQHAVRMGPGDSRHITPGSQVNTGLAICVSGIERPVVVDR